MRARGTSAADCRQTGPHRRDRTGLRRVAAGRRVRPGRLPRRSGTTSTRRRPTALNAGTSYIPDVPDRRRGRRASPPAPCAPRPTRPPWPTSTSSTSACRRRCARPRTRTCPTSCRRSRSRPRCCARASSSSSSRRPIPAPPTKCSSRPSRPAGWWPARTSSWRSRPSASIPATRPSSPGTSRRWSAASTTPARKAAQALYGSIIDTIVPVSSTRVAEMVKLLENTFRAVNIGLVNELALMCGRLGIDVWEVIDAAKTKPFGFMPFYPGPGLGGHCIPIDPVLPVVEGAAERLRGAVHRAGRPDQRRDARVRRQPRRPRRSTRRRRRSTAPASTSSASPTSATSTTCASRRRSTSSSC